MATPGRAMSWPSSGESGLKSVSLACSAWPAYASREAAALRGKFWEMHDLVFEQQPSLSPQIIPVWAKKLGLDLEKFGNDLMEEAVAKQITEDRESGIRSGVNGTPTFFINGTRHDEAPDYDSLLVALESELAPHSP